jgi:hypothetical protein
MNAADHRQTDDGLRLYELYGKPFEAQHWGEYVAITPDGRTVLAPTLLEVMQQSVAAFGLGSYVFKVGERTVGRWR